MTKLFPIFALICSAVLCAFSANAQEKGAADTNQWVIQALSDVIPNLPEGRMYYDMSAGVAMWTNGVFVQNRGAVLTADSAVVYTRTSVVQADGHVRIESGGQLWTGDHITYNFKTKQMISEQFRTGLSPVFASGEGLAGNVSNRLAQVYTATNAFVTTDDIANPEYRVRASRIVIIPGQTVQMWNAVLLADNVPIFYFPYYKRNIGPRANNFNFIPGYDSEFGAYLLGTYTWFLGSAADGKIHVDYRSKRGPGFGPDLHLQMGRWGDLTLKYYYLHDNRPNTSTNQLPFFGNIPENRQRFYLGWQATPVTNFNVKALVNYQSDPLLVHDLYPGQYTQNPQPNTFVEANKYWDNWSLDALTTPRVNSFFSQIERLPDVQLTGFRQQILDTPLYYDSQSSVGWYRSFASNMTNGLYPFTNGFYVDSAVRADTFHQVSMPLILFNWLNVTPNAGGRFTYYSEASQTSNVTGDLNRGVFNTGVSASFKATALWTDAKNSLLDVDGLRHIIEPSATYVFVPDPSVPPAQLPQFDFQSPSLLIAPITFPDYNSIDSIDTMNVIRFGLRNVLQTKRDGQLEDLVNWNLMLDWRLDPLPGQTTFNDLYSQFVFRPRSWLTLESQIRYNLDSDDLNLSFHQITFSPNSRWSWGISHWYLRGGFISPQDENFISSTVFYRMDDNWGMRATHNFNVADGRLQQQYYTLYRDMRSWTAAVTFSVTDNVNSSSDVGISFSLSLKASPTMHVGEDVANRYQIVGQ